MKLGPVAKLDKKNEKTSKPVKLTFSLIFPFYLTKTENRTKKSLTQLSHYCFKKRYFSSKNANFL